MVAIIYLTVVLIIGHILCRRFYSFDSLPHRIAASFLVGLVVCTLATYLVALGFAWTDHPLLYGNLVFGIASVGVAAWFFKRNRPDRSSIGSMLDDPGTGKWDWIFTAIFFVISCWLMFGTFAVTDNNLKIGGFLWNDFGPNLSLVQSFAVGHNFPTEYPHFIGEPIRYHFLFWFQAGNLEFLGLNIGNSLNILSALTMTAMLVLIASFGRVVFESKAVGPIGALLFFFHGSLSFIPFLWSKGSVTEMFFAVINASQWLKSIYTYTGEQWGVWAMGTFLAQRHLPAAVGVFLVVLIFLVQKRDGRREIGVERQENEEPEKTEDTRLETVELEAIDASVSSPSSPVSFHLPSLASYLASGILIGLLPLWNGAIFVAAIAVIASMVLFFRNRVLTICLLVASIVVAVPQILFLRTGGTRGFTELFRWGYVVEPATIWNVTEYFAFTFGVKTLLAVIAIVLLTAFHRKLFVAVFSLAVLAFTTQLSTDIMNNHKFLNVWLILVNTFAAYTIVRIGRIKLAGKILAGLLLMFLALGGTIELFRIRNVDVVDVPFKNGPVYEFLRNETHPKDIFLTDTSVHSPILLSGRRIFYGWAYFGWSMGYPTGKRDEIYRKMFTERRPDELLRLLAENNIKYVAIDNGLRNGHLKAVLNEATFETNFPKVFVDRENKNGSLVIYKVPHLP